MAVPVIVLAAAAASGLYATAPYRAYRTCLADTVAAEAKAQAAPEDMLFALEGACPGERMALAAEVRRGKYKQPAEPAAAPGGAPESEDDRLIRPWRDDLIVKAIRRYQTYYTTGRLPKD